MNSTSSRAAIALKMDDLVIQTVNRLINESIPGVPIEWGGPGLITNATDFSHSYSTTAVNEDQKLRGALTAARFVVMKLQPLLTQLDRTQPIHGRIETMCAALHVVRVTVSLLPPPTPPSVRSNTHAVTHLQSQCISQSLASYHTHSLTCWHMLYSHLTRSFVHSFLFAFLVT
jgi:hypothetical protein